MPQTTVMLTPVHPTGIHGPTSLLRLLVPLGGGNLVQSETEAKHGCPPQQLPFRSGAQQVQTVQVTVSGRPGALPRHPAGSRREGLLPGHAAPAWYPETQPQRHFGPGQRLLAGGGASISIHLQRPLPPHHQPHNQQAAALPAAGFWPRPGGLGGSRPSPRHSW